MAGVESYLEQLVELGGGDLHLSPGRPPWVRAGGRLHALDTESAAPKDVGELLLKIASPKHRKQFERAGSVTFVDEYGDLGRFRIHVFRERLGTAAVARLIPGKVASFDELGLPEVARDLCSRRGGLVVVAGPPGSGKSTTLAAMIDLVNREREANVVTVEESTEFVHAPERSLIHQREVGAHCESFPAAVDSARREGADVILLGRIPDSETAEAALEAAASGGLVLAEMRAATAALAVERFLGFFPAGRRAYARAVLASSLKGVIVQRLLPRADGEGLVAAFEVLVATPAVANAIRESGARNVASAIQSGGRAGMKLLDDALLELVSAGTVSGREAASHAVDEEEFPKKCASAGIDLDTESPAALADESKSSGARRPTAAPIVTRRMSRAEMFLGEGSPERRHRRPGGRSRRAAFSEDAVPSNAGASAGPQDGSASHGEEGPASGEWADPRIVAGRQILVVDDDMAMRDLLVRMLQGAGARVTAVGEPSQALAEIATGSFDLAMFDILMPEMSGTDLYDRALDLTSALKERVVFVTGCRLDGRLNDRIASRGGRLLRKPFVADELLKAAAAALHVERQVPSERP